MLRVAQAGGIPCKRENVAHTQHVRTDEVGLQAHEGSVARGVVNNRLDAHAQLNLHAEGEGAHAHARHGAVGHIDGVGANALGILGAFNLLLRRKCTRWIHLHADDELAGAQLAQQRRGLVHIGRAIIRRRGTAGQRHGLVHLYPHGCDVIGFEHYVKRGAHFSNVHGCGAAAASHQACTLLQEGRHEACKVSGAGGIHKAPLYALGEAGVGHGDEVCARHGGMQRLHRLEERRGSHCAVGADDVGPCRGQPVCRIGGRVAVGGVAILRIGKRRDDGQIAEAARRSDGDLNLLERSKGLKEEQVGPRFPKYADLLAEDGVGLRARQRAVGCKALAQRPHVARDKERAPGHLAHVAHQLDGLEVEFAHGVAEAKCGQPGAVGAKGVRLDHIGAGAGIGLVNLADPAGAREHQLFEALFAAGTARKEHGAHGAIHQERAFGHTLQKGVHVMVPSWSGPCRCARV